MDTRYETVLKYGLYILAFLIPWITWERWVFTHATSKVFLFYGGVLFLLAFWFYALIVDSRYRLKRNEWYMMTPLFVYLVWMGITAVTARNSGLAIWGSLMRGTGLMTLGMITVHTTMLVSLAKRYAGFITTYLKWVVAGGAVVALSVWFGDEGLHIPMNILRKASGGGVTGNSTLAGAYLIFILGFTFLIATERNKRSGWLWVLVGGAVFSPVFLSLYGMFTGSGVLGSARAALGAIVVGGGVGALVYLMQSTKKALRTIGWTGIIAGVGMFVVVWHQFVTPGTSLHNKFVELASGTRFAFWEISQKVLTERPLLGYGPENFPIAQARYFDPQFLSRNLAFEAWTDQPHNVYYNNAVAGGYPGVLFYVLFVGSLVVLIYRNAKLTATQKSVLISTLVAYLVQDLVSFDGFITIYIVGIYAAVAYGNRVIPQTQDTIQKKETSRHQYLLVMLLAVSVVAMYVVAYQPAQKAKLFGEVLGSKLNERYPRYREFLEGSSVGNYWDVSGFAYDEYKLYAANPLVIKQDQKVLPHAIKDVDAYIAYLEQLAQTNKTDYRLYFTLVNLYNTKIFLSDISYDASLAQHIRDYIDYAQILAPTDPRIYWLYAQLAAWKGDIPAVISAYQSGIAIDPTLPVSHKLLLQFLKGIGNEKLYKQAFQYAQSQVPNFTVN